MSGFRRGCCALDGIIDLVTTVEQQKGHCKMRAAIFLDTKGAFDNVTHDALMTAIENLGLRSQLYRWVSSYLTDCTIIMSTHARTTNCHSVNKGVPKD